MTVTEEDCARCVALTRSGATAVEIADMIGVTARTVQRIRAKCGIAKPAPVPLTDAEIRRAAEVLDGGGSIAEAARTIGRSQGAVYARFPGRGWTRAQCAEFVATVQRFRGVL